ncbi:MAG: glycine--tRNA ligase, partial [Lachnospiraceae bacterium]|nr:glycine--tRNA ligase [Lachnospiraceae bacterium]
RHAEYSGQSMEYLDPVTNEKYVPYVVESTYGLDRLVLAVLFECLEEEELPENDVRTLLRLPAALAPIKINVLPIAKKKHGEKAMEIRKMLSEKYMTSYDESGSIGKRYRRGDAIGIPFAISVDDETVENDIATIRFRDSMEQIKVPVSELMKYFEDKFVF